MAEVQQVKAITKYMKTEKSLAEFTEILGIPADAYSHIADVLLAVKSDARLWNCTEESIYKSALRSASLRLSVDESLGLAYLVAYKNVCTFQPSYKGLYDLAMRTNRYLFINTSPVHEGEEWIPDPLTGLHRLEGGKISDKVIGWFGYFQLTPEPGMSAGFQKTMYMTIEEIHAHGKRYSPSYKVNHKESIWIKNPKIAEKKTILRQLLTQWGVFNSRDKKALEQVEADHSDLVEGEFTETTEEIEKQGFDHDELPAEKRTGETIPETVEKPKAGSKPWDKGHVDMILSVTELVTEEAAIELLDRSGMSKKARIAAVGKWGKSYASAIVRGNNTEDAINHAKKFWQDFGEVKKE